MNRMDCFKEPPRFHVGGGKNQVSKCYEIHHAEVLKSITAKWETAKEIWKRTDKTLSVWSVRRHLLILTDEGKVEFREINKAHEWRRL